MDWCVYHSEKTMGHPYSELGGSAVYSKTLQNKLCLGETIWVVQGGLDTPTDFTLVDCFEVNKFDYPPFEIAYSAFVLKVSGQSLLSKPVALDRSLGSWFSVLHGKYLSKQRFFAALKEIEIAHGLRACLESNDLVVARRDIV